MDRLRAVCHVLLKIAGFHSIARGLSEREREGESDVPFRWDIAGDRFFCNTFESHIVTSLLLPRDHLCQVRAIMNELWTIVTGVFFEASTIKSLHWEALVSVTFPPVSISRNNV